MLLQTTLVKVSAAFDADQVGQGGRCKNAGAMSSKYSWRNCFVNGEMVLQRHLYPCFMKRIRFGPGDSECRTGVEHSFLVHSGAVLNRSATPVERNHAIAREVAL